VTSVVLGPTRAGRYCALAWVNTLKRMSSGYRIAVVAATGQVGTLILRERSFPARVPRPPVVFCRDGEARLVLRRESFEDLTARDVR
jgi:hypothetical protein